MPLKLNGSTSGYVIVDAPAVAGTNTLTLPAATDTVTVNAAAQTLSNKTLASPAITGTMSSTGDISTTGTVVMGSAYTMRNKIINGAMGISQRGTSFSSPANQSYTLDRWKFWGDGSGGTLTISQTAITAGELPPFSYYMRVNQSAGATARTYMRVNQAIEGLEQFSGQTIAISFYAKCASGTVASNVRCDRYFGTGGSPSSADNMGFSSGGSPTITTTWTRFTAVSTVTSTAGKTFGTNNDSYLLVGIDLPTSGTFDVYITGFQVEYGSIATPFELRQIQQELAMCQRYYEKSYDVNTNPATATSNGMASGYYNATNGINQRFPIRFAVTKRSTPTMLGWDAAGNANKVTCWNSGNAQTNNLSSGSRSFVLIGTQSAAFNEADLGGYYAIATHWTADSEL
jgi:hypothetical protein